MEEERDKIAEQFLNEVLGEGYLEENSLFMLMSENKSSILIIKSWPVFHTWMWQCMSIPYDEREVFRPVLKDWVDELYKGWDSCDLEAVENPESGEKRPVRHIREYKCR